MIKHVNIYDCDGVIACSLHRYKTMPCGTRIDLDHWRANEHLAHLDSPGPLLSQYRADLRKDDTFVIVATARVMNAQAWHWFKTMAGMPDYFIHRAATDTRSGAELKIKGLTKFFNLKPFKNAEFIMHEDNAAYLRAICEHFNIRGVFIPSKQGH